MKRLCGRDSRNGKASAAFSLVEVMIALGLFGLMATGFTASCLFARRAAESAVAENTALCLAQGYMNQLKTFSYGTLMASANDASIALPTMSSATATDYIYQNAFTDKTLVTRVNNDGSTAQTLVVGIMPVISFAGTASGTGANWSIAGIEIFYRWRDPVRGVMRTESIRSAKSN